jgi:hypothetical protein
MKGESLQGRQGFLQTQHSHVCSIASVIAQSTAERRRRGAAFSPGPFGFAQGRLSEAESWVGPVKEVRVPSGTTGCLPCDQQQIPPLRVRPPQKLRREGQADAPVGMTKQNLPRRRHAPHFTPFR